MINAELLVFFRTLSIVCFLKRLKNLKILKIITIRRKKEGRDRAVPDLWVALGGLVVSVLATGPKVRGFKPGRGRWILRVMKSVARLSSEGK
jgi:hypothetical protein